MSLTWSRRPRFNEAGGFLPRKRGRTRVASPVARCFNEAGGFLPRKRDDKSVVMCFEVSGFNEAGGFLPRKLETLRVENDKLRASMRPGDFSPGNVRGLKRSLMPKHRLQ